MIPTRILEYQKDMNSSSQEAGESKGSDRIGKWRQQTDYEPGT